MLTIQSCNNRKPANYSKEHPKVLETKWPRQAEDRHSRRSNFRQSSVSCTVLTDGKQNLNCATQFIRINAGTFENDGGARKWYQCDAHPCARPRVFD